MLLVNDDLYEKAKELYKNRQFDEKLIEKVKGVVYE